MKTSIKILIGIGTLLAVFAIVIIGGVIGYRYYQNQQVKEVVYGEGLLALLGHTPEELLQIVEESNQGKQYYQKATINKDGTISFYVTPRQNEKNIKTYREGLKDWIQNAEEVGVKIKVNEEEASAVYYLPKKLENEVVDALVATLSDQVLIQLYVYDRDEVHVEFRTAETDKYIEEVNIPDQDFWISDEELNQ